MPRMIRKVGANDPCPCGRLNKKYKGCCRGKVDWETLPFERTDLAVRHLATRGKNQLFMNLVLDALQIDNESRIDLVDFKHAFTPAAVRKIYEAVLLVWPDGDDLKRVLREEAALTSGLYIGQYEPELVRRGVTRHSLYADRILLVDPLVHPAKVRDEFNPLLHPEEHRTTTLRWISLWVQLLPWINEGVIGFVRDPGDFYPGLALKTFTKTEELYKTTPELIELRKQEAGLLRGTESYKEFQEWMLLNRSDDQLRAEVREYDPKVSEEMVELVLADFRRRRETHPYFIEPMKARSSELHMISSGTNYELAKMIALHSGSYLMTDLRVRWKEMELDRARANVDAAEWSPFAKAFQNLSFKFLDSVPLDAALSIRKEGRLETLRLFLRKVWAATSKAKPFDDANIPLLAAELDARVREAEVEWKKIDRELLQMMAAPATGGVLAAGPLIAAGHAAFVGAAAIVLGGLTLAQSRKKRAEYKLSYPAGFFLDLQQGRYSGDRK